MELGLTWGWNTLNSTHPKLLLMPSNLETEEEMHREIYSRLLGAPRFSTLAVELQLAPFNFQLSFLKSDSPMGTWELPQLG